MDNKPFVHLFETPLGYYIFDVNRNSIVKINKSVYELLFTQQKGTKPALSEEEHAEAKKVIDRMISEGYLSSKRVSEIIHNANEVLEFRLSNRMNKITLQVTQQCNLRCSYCIYSGTDYQRSHSNKKMSFETAKKGIDFLIANSRDSSRINVGFYGGEPLLEFEFVKKCIEYAEQNVEGKELSFSITTNGTLVTDEIISYLQQHNVDLVISLDGPKEIHDKNRIFAHNGSGSFDVIMANLESARVNYPEYFKKIFFNIVLDPASDFKCTNDFYTNYETVKNAHLTSSIAEDKYSREKLYVSSDFVAARNYEIFKVYLHKLNRLDIKNVSPIVSKVFTDVTKTVKSLVPSKSLPDKAHHGGPCIPGELRLFINAEGVFYPCERVSENSEMMKIGHIDHGYDLDKVRQVLNIGKLTEDNCKNCWALRYCSLCAAHADNIKSLSPKMKISKCNGVRISVENKFKDYVILKELGHSFADDLPVTQNSMIL